MLQKREAPAEAPARGAYYKDDGPGEHPPPNLDAIPDAVPRVEPLHRFANRPYQVFGREFVPLASVGPFRQRGMASWYGKRFHGGNTSSGEPYDMYAMTAAHPTLPVPSYARVTNVANGRGVVVRVNDRGPFHADRAIDLSYAAAYRLGIAQSGSALVEIEAIVPGGTLIAAVPSGLPGVPPSVAPDAAPAPGAEAKGVYLQLGAFSVRENAETFRARIIREFAWLSDALHVIAGGALFRLHIGPYRSQDEARAVAERIRSETSLLPLLVVR
ncbi:MAG: septal ring lytic transglycosylase RlpA family protein [Betaproteobacteria bacterium]|nr:septal ring lytic transglycosylase RlpA family protein [Betaproteobacteria bacterium]